MKNVYLASKLHHAHWMRTIKYCAPQMGVTVVSTWHDSLTVEADDANSTDACIVGWVENRNQILVKADALVAYGMSTDRLNGTMIEIGLALSLDMPVYLVGDYPWGTWRHLPRVHVVDSLHTALERITKL